MPIHQDDINLELTPEQLAQFDAALDTLETLSALFPVVSTEEKARHVKPPDGAGDWMSDMATRAEQNIGKLARDYDPAEVARDLKLDADLAPRQLRLQRILDHVGGARFLAGSDAFSALLSVRRQLRGAGVAGVDDNLSDGLARFFSRSSKAETANPTPPPP